VLLTAKKGRQLFLVRSTGTEGREWPNSGLKCLPEDIGAREAGRTVDPLKRHAMSYSRIGGLLKVVSA